MNVCETKPVLPKNNILLFNHGAVGWWPEHMANGFSCPDPLFLHYNWLSRIYNVHVMCLICLTHFSLLSLSLLSFAILISRASCQWPSIYVLCIYPNKHPKSTYQFHRIFSFFICLNWIANVDETPIDSAKRNTNQSWQIISVPSYI